MNQEQFWHLRFSEINNILVILQGLNILVINPGFKNSLNPNFEGQ